MKFWLEAEMETSDKELQCSKCCVFVSPPKHIFVEFVLRQGGLPNCDELHPDPTGRHMCEGCAKMSLF
jgi:hypothetical protein